MKLDVGRWLDVEWLELSMMMVVVEEKEKEDGQSDRGYTIPLAVAWHIDLGTSSKRSV
jgi:hypothetical protein